MDDEKIKFTPSLNHKSWTPPIDLRGFCTGLKAVNWRHEHFNQSVTCSAYRQVWQQMSFPRTSNNRWHTAHILCMPHSKRLPSFISNSQVLHCVSLHGCICGPIRSHTEVEEIHFSLSDNDFVLEVILTLCQTDAERTRGCKRIPLKCLCTESAVIVLTCLKSCPTNFIRFAYRTLSFFRWGHSFSAIKHTKTYELDYLKQRMVSGHYRESLP